jgi:hypothetical protein
MKESPEIVTKEMKELPIYWKMGCGKLTNAICINTSEPQN